MTRRKYKYNDYNKSAPIADATKYFIIYEGKSKEPNYFEAFNKAFIDPNKAFVCHVLEEDTGVEGNTPLKLKERAQAFINKPPSNIQVTPAFDDKFRFVLDVDKHNPKHLNELNDFCKSLNNGKTFVSNFCFEVWLWAHVDDIAKITASKSSELKTEFGEIQDLHYPHDFMNIDIINKAIYTCKKSDDDETNFFPKEKNSKVYQLIEELISHSHLNIEVEIEKT